ncbi:hypothetical protein B9Z55_000764 [Caenorhabditis nigoni]|uniref:BAR domain-containing protein n=1 Tax=Caenorhabditis nigoni TaxID=1611254 RepID=A0A2G5VV49_9PELO|nr:hypothetical protein B9Z55_000764 [Caenorhabditis nigoni]
MASSIKEELICEQEAESQVLQIAEAAVEGIDMDGLTSMTPGLTQDARLKAVNALLNAKKVILEQTPEGVVRVKVNSSQQIAGTEEEQAIYTLIEESKNRGIWIKELRERTGRNQLQLRKALKSLETKKLVKTIKAVGSTKKCYILFDLEADKALTGGTFYSDQQLDSELINILISVSGSYAASRRKLVLEEFPNNIQMQRESSYIRPQEDVRLNRELPPPEVYRYIVRSRRRTYEANRSLNNALMSFYVGVDNVPRLPRIRRNALPAAVIQAWRNLKGAQRAIKRTLLIRQIENERRQDSSDSGNDDDIDDNNGREGEGEVPMRINGNGRVNGNGMNGNELVGNGAGGHLGHQIDAAEPTKLDDVFNDMEKNIDTTYNLITDLVAGTNEYLQPNPATRAKMATQVALSKVRGTTKTSPYPQTEGMLAEVMQKYGQQLGDGSDLGKALNDAAEGYRQMADIKYQMEDNVKQNFLDPLIHLQNNELKDVNHHRTKLKGRRLDYDCKKRQQRRDDEMIQVEEKLEESKRLAEMSMFNVLSNDVEQISQLRALIEAQLDFHGQAAQCLENLQQQLGHRIKDAASRPREKHVPLPVLGNESRTPRSRSPAPSEMTHNSVQPATISGSVTNWKKGKTTLLKEVATKEFRVVEIKKDDSSQKWIQSLTGDKHFELITNNGDCDDKAAPPEILKVPRFDSIIGNNSSSIASIVDGVLNFIRSNTGYAVKNNFDVVGGVNTMKWVSCVNGTSANDTKVLVELRYAGDDSIAPALKQFSNPILLSIRLAELKDFNTTMPDNHISIEFDRYDIPDGVEDKAQLAHGVFCANRNETELKLKPMDEYAAVLSYYNYVNKTSEVVDIFYSKQNKVFAVSGASIRNLLKTSNYSQGVDYILHDYNYGYEFTMKNGACDTFGPAPETTNDVIVNNKKQLTMQRMEDILVDPKLKWSSYQDPVDLAGNTFKAFRALDSAGTGKIVELHLTDDGEVHSMNRFDAKTRKIEQSLIVTRVDQGTSKLNVAMVQMAGCYDNGSFTNNTWVVPIKDKNITNLHIVGLSNPNKAVAETISKNVYAVIPYRVIVFYVENRDGGLSMLLRLAEKTTIQPSDVGYNYTAELTTAELFSKMNASLFSEKMPIVVEVGGQKEEWIADGSAMKSSPTLTPTLDSSATQAVPCSFLPFSVSSAEYSLEPSECSS